MKHALCCPACGLTQHEWAQGVSRCALFYHVRLRVPNSDHTRSGRDYRELFWLGAVPAWLRPISTDTPVPFRV